MGGLSPIFGANALQGGKRKAKGVEGEGVYEGYIEERGGGGGC